MSLILKGIDLPKEGNDECKMLTVDIFPSGNIQVREQGDGCCDGYSLDKSAIQIPKGHGRIGDLDELQVNVIKAMTYGDALHEVKHHPAMLESEVMPNE